jgi:hypothetical protein
MTAVDAAFRAQLDLLALLAIQALRVANNLYDKN